VSLFPVRTHTTFGSSQAETSMLSSLSAQHLKHAYLLKHEEAETAAVGLSEASLTLKKAILFTSLKSCVSTSLSGMGWPGMSCTLETQACSALFQALEWLCQRLGCLWATAPVN